MKIRGVEVGFAMTLGALKEICKRAPGGDIDRMNELFDSDNVVDALDNMAWFICVLNKWHTYKETRSFEGSLVEDDIYALNIDEIKELFSVALATFKQDTVPETEVEGKK